MFEADEEKILGALRKKGLINEEQEEKARKSGKTPLHEAFVEMKALTKDQLFETIAEELGVAYIDLANYSIQAETISLVPEETARKFLSVPVFVMDNTLGVAMADPRNVEAIDQIRIKTGLFVEPYLSAEEDIRRVLDRQFQNLGTVQEMIEDLEVTRLKDEDEILPELKDLTDEAPITKLVNLIFAQAVRDRASDIHIEPDENVLRIRFRIDGMLYEIPSPPKHLKAAITSRIKVMSNLNIAETRRPQDGNIRMRVEGQTIDVRVSVVPTVFGENVVLRILNPQAIAIGLEQIGFSELMLEKFNEVIHRPHGVLLNTGPTGSGKTTTLYAALQLVNTIDKNIITVEDPVEYRLRLIRQIPVNPRAGVTFANGLRAILRQDPDIIMVGEIRDAETADIAIQAALTGHFVFSTLHTNDAVGAIPRLVHMGVEPFLVAAALEGIMAQRLVRRLCPRCREPYSPSDLILEQLQLDLPASAQFYRGRGCDYCRGTGYKGRAGVFELVDMTPAIRTLTLAKAQVDEIRATAGKEGTRFMKDDVLDKVLNGTTTIEEMVRVTGAKVDIGKEEEKEPGPEGAVEPPVIPLGAEEQEPEASLAPKDVDEYQDKITHWLARGGGR
jgi:type IV pilus assembly protein PilB